MIQINRELILEKLSFIRDMEYDNLFISYPVKEEFTDSKHFTANALRFIFIVHDGNMLIQQGLQQGTIKKLLAPKKSVMIALPTGPSGALDDTPDYCSFTVGFYAGELRLIQYSQDKSHNRTSSEADGLIMGPYMLPLASQMINETIISLLMSNPKEHIESIKLLVRSQISMINDVLNIPEKENKSQSKRSWLNIENYINNNLKNDLSRETVAKKIGYSPNYLSALCRQETSLSYNEFVTRQKLAKALSLLELNLSLDEIASNCGFNYTSYFLRLFKKYYGKTPGKYRKRF